MSTEVTEGESIEKRIDRMVETNEPIGETAQMIYTKKTDGVIPAYDIRTYRDWETDRKSTRLNSSHSAKSRMPSSA